MDRLITIKFHDTTPKKSNRDLPCKIYREKSAGLKGASNLLLFPSKPALADPDFRLFQEPQLERGD